MKGAKANQNNAGTMKASPPDKGAALTKAHGGKKSASGAPIKVAQNVGKNKMPANRLTK